MSKIAPRSNNPRNLIMVLVGLVLLLILFQRLHEPALETKEITYNEFMNDIALDAENQQRIVEVVIQDGDIRLEGKRKDATTFAANVPFDQDIRKKLEEHSVQMKFERQESPSLWKSILINSIPIFLVIILLIFLFRNMQMGGGKAMSFGKSRAKLVHDMKGKITFNDIEGIEESKAELVEIIDFLKDPKKFSRLGARIPKGVLLIGTPGTGKTLLAKAIAGEAGVPFFSISGSDFVEMFVGVGASRVRDLFDQAKKNAPCIVFIDEIDAVGRHRGAGLGGGHDEREQTLNQLLVEMDGFESNEGVIIIAATNRVDVLDPALLRPGRFDRRVIVPKPDVRGREGILKVHSRKTPLADDVNLRTIAQGTPGLSGADLENLVNEAALVAARLGHDQINMHHFELAKDKVLMGPERRSMIMSEEEKYNTAVHEAGHALVGLKVPGSDPIHKMSIIPRGQALGVTVMLPQEDRLSLTKDNAEGFIIYAMGGRAAEALVFKRQTTGAGDDIRKATQIAHNMVCKWGMSDVVGPISIGKDHDEVFLGRELQQSQAYSDRLRQDIDEEVHRIVNTCYERALKILEEHQAHLLKLADALIIKETVTGDEINRILLGEDVVADEERRAYESRKANNGKLQAAAPESAKTETRPSERAAAKTSMSPLPQGT